MNELKSGVGAAVILTAGLIVTQYSLLVGGVLLAAGLAATHDALKPHLPHRGFAR